jgi:hypothetical protein
MCRKFRGRRRSPTNVSAWVSLADPRWMDGKAHSDWLKHAFDWYLQDTLASIRDYAMT